MFTVVNGFMKSNINRVQQGPTGSLACVDTRLETHSNNGLTSDERIGILKVGWLIGHVPVLLRNQYR